MISKKSVIYRFLCIWWVLIIMPPRNRRIRIMFFCELTYDMIINTQFTQNIGRAYSMFYPYEGYRSVTPLDAARVNRTIFHNHSVH